MESGDGIQGLPDNATFKTLTVDNLTLTDPNGVGGGSKVKTFFFTSQGFAAGTYYTAGFYNAPAADANLTQLSATQVLGAANVPYGAHAFLVAGGVGSASGGTGAVEIEVSGTSMTDAGVRTGSDTEVIVADITAMSTNAYYETTKKWIGQVTYTLQNASGSTQTAFSADFNFGFAKYEDFSNQDFTVTLFEGTGMAGANDTAFNVELLYHNSSGWTYDAAAFVPGSSTVIYDFAAVYSTESDLDNGIDFAMKRTGLSQAVTGSGLEGVLVRITTGAANAVEHSTFQIGATVG